jgi:hypothetical protein
MDCGGVLTAPQRTGSYGNISSIVTMSAVGSKPASRGRLKNQHFFFGLKQSEMLASSD